MGLLGHPGTPVVADLGTDERLELAVALRKERDVRGISGQVGHLAGIVLPVKEDHVVVGEQVVEVFGTVGFER